MLLRIQHTIAVLHKVWNTFTLSSEIVQAFSDIIPPDIFVGEQVEMLRIQATNSVASETYLSYRTIEDKYVRQLSPQISKVEEFDECLTNWLRYGSVRLQRILEAHADNDDLLQIKRFFADHPTPKLAQQ